MNNLAPPYPALAVALRTRFTWSIYMLRTLLENRRMCVALVLAVCAYLVFLPFGLVAYRCPLHTTTALPCAGCGLSSAILSMLGGSFSQMWIQHPFAPYFAVLGIIVMGSAFLPEHLRSKWNSFWIKCEIRSRLHGIILSALCVFGALRLLGQLLITS